MVDQICQEIEAAQKFEARQTAGGKTLRPHQGAALSSWEARGRRGILEHATGSGKTFTAISAIRDALGKGEVPFVLVPSELLLLNGTGKCVKLFRISTLRFSDVGQGTPSGGTT